ncbi:sulfatase-like hydrolase/transferase [Persicirhabdus sediminis]|uniref:Sulfatase-like hydrolase/transferase n=1 Tax=Persicirhabdus sediminis TaxID=454144 RepID=A0A8J7MA21_9BACT|nr:sulfatase-like hydrolase/transferase [Persicirhabdus sediminis]MBK1789699.1 sulfatase-like hydrolase/transferase [Persicirhabdus sediminis]
MRINTLLCSATAALSIGAAAATAAPQKPNIVVIMADDLGYGDVSYNPQGEGDFETPHIDSIANHGTSFTSGYAMNMVCGPSRAGFVTGRYQQRFGYHDNTGPRVREHGIKQGLPLELSTIGNYLSDAGYVTGLVGKWHDGDEQEFWPYNRGFQEFYGFNNGAANYFVGATNQQQKDPWQGVYREDAKRVPNFDEYMTDAFGIESVKFVERNKDKPFFLFLAYNAPHGPMQATKEDLAKFSHIENEMRRTNIAMVHNMDKNIGLLLEKLEEEKLMDNTIIFFTSDNGGCGFPQSSNKPLRGVKGGTLEGGIRVPYLVRWDGVVPAGKTLDEPANGIDITATMLQLAIGETKDEWKLDGVDLMPLLTGKVPQLEKRYLYWDNVTNSAIRDREWKYVTTNDKSVKGKRVTGLFRISEDISESNDLSKQYPEVAERMKKALKQWQSENEKPRFGWGAHIGPKVGYRGKHKN